MRKAQADNKIRSDMAETVENLLLQIASPFAPAAKPFTGATCCDSVLRCSQSFMGKRIIWPLLPCRTCTAVSSRPHRLLCCKLCCCLCCMGAVWLIWQEKVTVQRCFACYASCLYMISAPIKSCCRGTLSSCAISILHGILTCTLGFWQVNQ